MEVERFKVVAWAINFVEVKIKGFDTRLGANLKVCALEANWKEEVKIKLGFELSSFRTLLFFCLGLKDII